MNKFENTIELIVRLIIKKDDKFLLCKNLKEGHYFLPGGHVEFGDTLEETIYKEMSEELALNKEDVSNISFNKYIENSYEHKEQKHCEINMVFTAELKDGIEIKSRENHIDFEWIGESEISNVILFPKGVLE
jgi:8-oxo-dGTP diphosphatase